jgi:hypothetical protein
MFKLSSTVLNAPVLNGPVFDVPQVLNGAQCSMQPRDYLRSRH